MERNKDRKKISAEILWKAVDAYEEGKPEKVKCPHCHTNLEVKRVGASYQVHCQTPGCYSGGLRGI